MKKPFSKVTLWISCIYSASILGTIVYGNKKYGYLREIHPNQTLTNPPVSFELFHAYGQFLDISIIILALLLGVLAALLGLISNNILGVASLAAGIVLTALGYAFLPRLYFLGGDFTAWGYWLVFGFYAYTGSWILITLLGFILKRILADRTSRL